MTDQEFANVILKAVDTRLKAYSDETDLRRIIFCVPEPNIYWLKKFDKAGLIEHFGKRSFSFPGDAEPYHLILRLRKIASGAMNAYGNKRINRKSVRLVFRGQEVDKRILYPTNFRRIERTRIAMNFYEEAYLRYLQRRTNRVLLHFYEGDKYRGLVIPPERESVLRGYELTYGFISDAPGHTMSSVENFIWDYSSYHINDLIDIVLIR